MHAREVKVGPFFGASCKGSWHVDLCQTNTEQTMEIICSSHCFQSAHDDLFRAHTVLRLLRRVL